MVVRCVPSFAKPVCGGRHAQHPMLCIGRHEQRIFTLPASHMPVLRAMDMKTRSAVHSLRVGVQERVQQLQQNQDQPHQRDIFIFDHY